MCFLFSPEAARHFGQLRARLDRAGTPIGSQDLLIGAHAGSEGLTLVTNNRREFDRIPGLQVENWV
jgi:tRNA(fMet)-specific endonuclease VapC